MNDVEFIKSVRERIANDPNVTKGVTDEDIKWFNDIISEVHEISNSVDIVCPNCGITHTIELDDY